jgi:glucoamylase
MGKLIKKLQKNLIFPIYYMNYFFDNILEDGSIMASPSIEPDYRFHWVRDSAIVIKSIINLYVKDPKPKYIEIMENYIKTELKHINHHPAEPKFHLNKSPYTGDWGRPQNDGPAMRGIICIKLLSIMSAKFAPSLYKIIHSDLSYTMDEIDQPCFDLWEEEFGYHLYTRMLQTKLLYEAFKNTRIKNKEPKLTPVILTKTRENLSHHFTKEGINSSYNIHGNILRKYDSSFLLGLSHVDYDLPLLDTFEEEIDSYVVSLTNEFDKIYPVNKIMNIPFMGRYKEDKYFTGNPWIITTIALYQYWNHKNKELEGFINFITLLRDKKMDLAEQLDKNNCENRSVERLTWNYAELITLMKELHFSSLFLL